MTERGLPIVDGAPACPFVAFDEARDDRSDRPDPRHRCYAESPPAPRARAHQEAYCLSSSFPVCPMFQDWARREAARVAASGGPAERLRDVPARREAGERTPAFGPESGTTAAAGPGPTLAAADEDAGSGGGSIAPHGIPAPHDEDVETGAAGREPWDLPPRRPAHPEWSAPPPWSPPRPAAAADEGGEMPGFLRGAVPGGIGGSHPAWPPPAPDAGAADEDADEAGVEQDAGREARMARLRALGMGDAGGEDPDGIGAALAAAAPGPPRAPVTGPATGRGPAGRLGAAVAAGRGGAGGGTPAAGGGDASRATPEGGASGERRTGGGLRGLLGLDRRPKVGSSRPPRRAEREPAWERPRRFEAYPTLKTRVGLPMPSRIVLALGAILIAAAILFFVPPLFLGKGGGTGPGASPSAPGRSAAPSGPAGSGAVSSGAPSVGPTVAPTPKQKTYTIKQGDTLSTIAKRFGVTVEAILAANKQIKNPNKIAVGDVIVIPTAAPSEVVDGGASASP